MLDIRAQDETGRQFNIEMQIVVHRSLRDRLRYYWAQLYGTQLNKGQEYDQLRPFVSICFVDGMLFPERSAWDLEFALCTRSGDLSLSDHAEFHIFQLQRFAKEPEDLANELKLRVYFLDSGGELDLDRIPERLRTAELEEAMGRAERDFSRLARAATLLRPRKGSA